MKKPTNIIMPRSFANGNDALRMMDMLEYSTKESSLLFMAARTFQEHPLEGPDLFGRLEDVFESLSAIEKACGGNPFLFRLHAQQHHKLLEKLLERLSGLVRYDLPAPKNYAVLAG